MRRSRKPLCSQEHRGFESPPLRFICWAFLSRGSTAEVSFSRPSGEFGGNSVANATALMGNGRTE